MKPIPVSPKLSLLAESLTVAVDMKVQARQLEGHDIVNLGVGQPDFPTPEPIRAAAARAVEEGMTRYTPPGGIPALREAAAGYLRETGVPAEAANTVVSCGAKHSLYNALAAVLQPGDQVLMPVPFWVTYPEQVKLAEGIPVPVAPSTGMKVTPDDLDRAGASRARVLILNSPSNPSGVVYARQEVQALVEWCLRHEVLILSDEIYDRLVYDGVHATSPASLGSDVAARTITVNGVSKAFAMTGWRIGFMSAPSEVAAAVLKLQGQVTGNPAAASQAAALAALTGPRDVVETMRAAYERRRNLVLEELSDVDCLELPAPEGAFYAFPRVTGPAAALGSVALAERMVEAGVGIVPGAGFGADDHVRLSFAVDDARLREGVRRFRQGLQDLA